MPDYRLGIDVDSSSIPLAAEQLDTLVPAAQRAESAIDSMAMGIQNDLEAVLIKGFNELGSTSKAMLAELQRMGNVTPIPKSLPGDVERTAMAFNKLKASIDPSYRASLELEVAQKKVNAAIKAGVISAEQGADAMRRFAAAQTMGIGNMRDTRGMIQNTSYQLQDFIVQVQGGTDASRALAMQLPQLLGGLGPLGAALGVLAGVSIPLFATMLGKSGGSAEDFAESLEKARDAVTALDAVIELQKESFDELAEKYSGSRIELEKWILSQERVAQAGAIATVRELVNEYSALADQAVETTYIFNDMGDVVGRVPYALSEGAREIDRTLGITGSAAEALSDAFDSINPKGTFEEIADQLAAVLALMDQNADAVGIQEEAFDSLYARVSDSEGVMREFAAKTKEAGDNAQATLEIIDIIAGSTDNAAAAAAGLATAWGSVVSQTQLAAQWAAQAASAGQGAGTGAVAGAFGTGVVVDAAGVGGVPSSDPSGYDLFDTPPLSDETYPLIYEPPETPKAGRGGRKGGKSQAEKDKEAYDNVVEALEREIDMIGKDSDAQKLNDALRRAKVDAMSMEGQNITMLVTKYVELQREQERIDDFNQMMTDSTMDFFDTWMDRSGGLSEALEGLISQFARMALYNGIGNLWSGSGAAESGIGGFISSIFMPKREIGGDVEGGQGYLVGENGPERFFPETSGTIRPNGSSDAGGSTQVTLNYQPQVDARGADSAAIARLEANQQKMAANFEKTFKDKVEAYMRDPRNKGTR